MSRVLIFVALCGVLRPVASAAEATTAQITYPVNGAVDANMSQPITWTSVAGAQASCLYVGTTAGAKDLVNSGGLESTSYLASGLPSGPALYARIWVEVDGIWRYTDSMFTASASAALVPTLTYPANGAVNANLSQPITWTGVANVQAYYLYVGTTVGAKNLVDSGGLQSTSYVAINLPSGQTLYARIWAEVGGLWRYTDSTFSAAVPLVPNLTYPVNGALNANLAQPITWSAVPNTQFYYLYVGTTVGANDLVNSGGIQSTAYLASGLPGGQTLYARIWAQVGGVWRYTDSTFTATTSAAMAPTLTYPPNGAANANFTQAITWTSVANAQAYCLYVGTTAGAKNLVDTGGLQATSFLASGLPSGQTLYARVWAEVSGVWRYTDSPFSAAPTVSLAATLTYPLDGATGIDQTQAATWTTVADADWYYLYVGTTPGAKDIIDSNGTHATSFPIAFIPAGRTLYARLWTSVGGVWRYRDSTFTAAPMVPAFLNPVDGAVGVDGSQPFRWTSPTNAQAHQLLVGTSPGSGDLFDSGQIGATSVTVPGLPATGTLYARVLSNVRGVWKHSDVAFTRENAIPLPAVIVLPADGESAFDTAQPFAWSPVPLARAYRLRIGSTPGGSNLHDSGEIRVTQRFVPNLPLGPLFGRLETKIDGQWYASDFTFAVSANTVSTREQIKSALWATHVVRDMSLSDNFPFSWTPLADAILNRRALRALCNDYAETLLQVLSEVNLQLPARRLDVALNPNVVQYDAHTLAEMFNPTTGRWMLLDPTFDLSVTRTDDGGVRRRRATAEDVSTSTNARQFGDVSYQFLGPRGDFYARNYYLDYPLLFANVAHSGQALTPGQGAPVLPFMEPITLPMSPSQGVYIVGCSGEQTARLRIDHIDTVVDCSGIDGLSHVFGAGLIETTAQTSPSVMVYRPRRYVF